MRLKLFTARTKMCTRQLGVWNKRKPCSRDGVRFLPTGCLRMAQPGCGKMPGSQWGTVPVPAAHIPTLPPLLPGSPALTLWREPRAPGPKPSLAPSHSHVNDLMAYIVHASHKCSWNQRITETLTSKTLGPLSSTRTSVWTTASLMWL